MNDTEVELLEILRKMRSLGSLGDAEQELRMAGSYLAGAVTALAADTPYVELSLKIVATYASTFEPGAIT